MNVEIKRENRKDVMLKVVEDKVLVLAPKRIPLSKIESYVIENYRWIERKINNSTNSYAELFSFKQVLICGEFAEVFSTLQRKTYVANKRVYLPEKYMKTKTLKSKALLGLVKTLAKEFLPQKISSIGSDMHLCPSKIELKMIAGFDWLICTSPELKEIIIDYRIIQLPSKLQNFLIVCAYIHFLYSNHKKEYLDVLRRYYPDYKRYADELSRFRFVKEVFI